MKREIDYINESYGLTPLDEKGADTMNVKIKRLSPDAVIPKYAREGDAGFDLYATEDVIIEPGETAKVPVGLAFELPAGYEMQIRPRSGVMSKTKLRVQLGTVDSGYRGEVAVMVDNIAEDPSGNILQYLTYIDGLDYRTKLELYSNETYLIRKGDRIAQGVINRVPTATFTEVDELSDTERGEGGFGSTGTSKRVESRKLSQYHTETTVYLDEE